MWYCGDSVFITISVCYRSSSVVAGSDITLSTAVAMRMRSSSMIEGSAVVITVGLRLAATLYGCFFYSADRHLDRLLPPTSETAFGRPKERRGRFCSGSNTNCAFYIAFSRAVRQAHRHRGAPMSHPASALAPSST